MAKGDPGDLFVTMDVDTAIRRGDTDIIRSLSQWKASRDEPSILAPRDPETHLEINLLGIREDLQPDAVLDSGDNYVIFGGLNLIQTERIIVDDLVLPVATSESFAVEKMVSERTGIKRFRDMQVLVLALASSRLNGARSIYEKLSEEWRYNARITLAEAVLLIEQNRIHFPGDLPELKTFLAELE
ncbi:MAG: hypothetical protein AAB229_02905 [Candidatus Hydrogenedentota bacterium]